MKFMSTASAIIPKINGMRIHVTNCFLFSQRELMLLHAKAQEFGMEVQCCNWHPAKCQLCIWIPMFATQQKEPECISIYSLIFEKYHLITIIDFLHLARTNFLCNCDVMHSMTQHSSVHISQGCFCLSRYF